MAMAKNMLPMTPNGTGIMSKVIAALVVVAILMLVVKHPSDAAHWVVGAWHLLSTVVGGLADFFGHLSSH
jgi:hypothetical protein